MSTNQNVDSKIEPEIYNLLNDICIICVVFTTATPPPLC